MDSEEVLELDDTNWEEKIEKNKKPVVVMFYSNTCAFCKQMEPYFFEYAKEFRNKIIFSRVNIVESPTIAHRYGVMGTPTFKFFCNGKPVHEMTGAVYPTLLKKAVEENLEHGQKCVNNATWTDLGINGYA